MFDFQDPDNQMPDEMKARVSALCDEFLNTIDGLEPSPVEVLQALASIGVFVLSEHITSREMCYNLFSTMFSVMKDSLIQAEVDGNVAWNLKRKH